MTRNLGMVAYISAATALTAAMPVVSEGGRDLILLAISVLAAIPVIRLVGRVPAADRRPFVLMAFALVWLVVDNVILLSGRNAVVGDLIVLVSNLHMLAAAVALVLRRGRADIGGLLDAGVLAVVVAALTWTIVLEPSLDRAGVPLAKQANLLATVLMISGILGTLIRVLRTSERFSAPLALFILSVLGNLAGAVGGILATGTVTAQSTVLRETIFVVAYALVGLAALHPRAADLANPCPVPPARLFVGRVIVLGGAIAVIPTVSGVREILGLHGDAALLIVGNLLIITLVGVRVARISMQREQAERRLLHQATHDLLTGLPNRAELWTRLDAALRREQETGHPSVVLLFCDLNGFKQVNDRLGHLAGDRLLTEVGARLDGLGVFAARYGGDEFVLLGEDAERLTTLVRAALAEPIVVAGEPIRVSASIGAVHSDARTCADDLIRRADQAMYQQKATRQAA
ncbi:hypothetical protein GCM10010112_21140 [Actinoplanes lobatus]|uniref:Diguanylate cyclase (GGDEF)-like protein n=1 Tax=Actinoplanes lobatus TaxID=113568 RepID=A0A7W7ML46_9ACTN|nr:GGDEF domain-containing protein [Actinoplanes lobatus]MBB4754369.1 diguanylate cyclase (GGDEF)-like protein [Actinoplanes lobatus]GGN62698.1 hypothetical protein GCM10010112_21140 [Actinoplanes lobatus]GIE40552.1 hypothetical protein Alo02nite_34500 [Actinoplanes lobatus]